MIQLLEAVDFGGVTHEGAVLQVMIPEYDSVHPAMHQGHRAHEARLNICDNDEIAEVVELIILSLVPLYGLFPCLLCQNHDWMVNGSPCSTKIALFQPADNFESLLF